MPFAEDQRGVEASSTRSHQKAAVGRVRLGMASGRVDLSALIGLEPGPDGRFVIPVLEILRPIALLAEAGIRHDW